MTSYANSYIHMSAIPVDGPISYGLQLPGEVGSSPSGPFYGAPGYPPSYGFESYGQHDASWMVEQQQHDLFHSTPTKRKKESGFFHPYHHGHETARSPTRTRFDTTVASSGNPLPSPTHHHKAHYPAAYATHSQPIQRSQSGAMSPRKRHSSADSVESLTGPTNYEYVPQGIFRTSENKQYQDLPFRKIGFPEPGIRVGEIGEFAFRLENANDFTLQHVTGKRHKLHIMWPGHETYYFHVNTICDDTKEPATHETTANKICSEIFTLRKMQVVNPSVARHWRISRVPGDGGIDVNQLFITRLVHRGGCNWQVEIWAPMVRRRHR